MPWWSSVAQKVASLTELMVGRHAESKHNEQNEYFSKSFKCMNLGKGHVAPVIGSSFMVSVCILVVDLQQVRKQL